MRFVTCARETGKVLSCLISSVLLVLLVPSASWSASDETEPSEPSQSSSPVSESASPSEEPTSPESSSPSPSGESSGSSTPVDDPSPAPAAPEAGTEPEPTAPETVYVMQEPAPGAALGEGTEESPSIVRLDEETTALLLLTSSLIAIGVGARVVGSMGGR